MRKFLLQSRGIVSHFCEYMKIINFSLNREDGEQILTVTSTGSTGFCSTKIWHETLEVFRGADDNWISHIYGDKKIIKNGEISIILLDC